MITAATRARRSHRGKRGRRLAAALGAVGWLAPLTVWLAAQACGIEPIEPGTEVRVEVTPAQVSLSALGETAQLKAVAKAGDGTPVSGVAIVWRTSSSAVATVTPGGLVTAVGEGQATVTAAAEGTGASADATVTVQQVPVQLAFRTEPSGARAEEPFAAQPVVEVQDANGNLVKKDAGRSVTMTIASNPGGASLSGTATVSTVGGVAAYSDLGIDRPGSGYTLRATSQGLGPALSGPFDVAVNVATVEVSPAALVLTALGAQSALAVVARSPSGAPVTGLSFEWTSSDTAVATVTPAGVVTAIADGGAWVSASYGGVSDSAAVTVSQRATSIAVTPQFSVLGVGETRPLGVTVRDSLGSEVASAAVQLTSRDAAVVSVQGLDMTGQAPGVADVVAASGSLADSARVAVVTSGGFAALPSVAPDSVRVSAPMGSTLTLDLWMIRPAGGSGDLASLSGALTWDATRLRYESSQSVEPGFTWVANETDVATGTLVFGTFSPSGSAGTFILARVVFTVIGASGGPPSVVGMSVTAAGTGAGADITASIVPVRSAIWVR